MIAPGDDSACADRSVSIDVHVDCHGLTDAGRQRPTNDDQFLIAELRKSLVIRQSSTTPAGVTPRLGDKEGHLFVVADGLGGHAGGREASRLALDAVVHYILDVVRLDIQDELSSVPRKCHEVIRSVAARTPECRGMGTTLTMAYVLWPGLYVVHAGDSRCYLLRSSQIGQITRDHTRAQQLVDCGALRPEEARESRLNHALWNAVGGNSDDLIPEAHKKRLRIGDSLILCTDGLTRHVEDGVISRVIAKSASAQESCRRLIEAANEAGGMDNITVVVAEFL